MGHSHNGKLYSHENEQSTTPCTNMDESCKHNVDQFTWGIKTGETDRSLCYLISWLDRRMSQNMWSISGAFYSPLSE